MDAPQPARSPTHPGLPRIGRSGQTNGHPQSDSAPPTLPPADGDAGKSTSHPLNAHPSLPNDDIPQVSGSEPEVVGSSATHGSPGARDGHSHRGAPSGVVASPLEGVLDGDGGGGSRGSRPGVDAATAGEIRANRTSHARESDRTRRQREDDMPGHSLTEAGRHVRQDDADNARDAAEHNRGDDEAGNAHTDKRRGLASHHGVDDSPELQEGAVTHTVNDSDPLQERAVGPREGFGAFDAPRLPGGTGRMSTGDSGGHGSDGDGGQAESGLGRRRGVSSKGVDSGKDGGRGPAPTSGGTRNTVASPTEAEQEGIIKSGTVLPGGRGATEDSEALPGDLDWEPSGSASEADGDPDAGTLNHTPLDDGDDGRSFRSARSSASTISRPASARARKGASRVLDKLGGMHSAASHPLVPVSDAEDTPGKIAEKFASVSATPRVEGASRGSGSSAATRYDSLLQGGAPSEADVGKRPRAVTSRAGSVGGESFFSAASALSDGSLGTLDEVERRSVIAEKYGPGTLRGLSAEGEGGPEVSDSVNAMAEAAESARADSLPSEEPLDRQKSISLADLAVDPETLNELLEEQVKS